MFLVGIGWELCLSWYLGAGACELVPILALSQLSLSPTFLIAQRQKSSRLAGSNAPELPVGTWQPAG
jgi:hypothetical protein